MANEEAINPFRPTGHDDYDRLVGMDVCTRDGEKIGIVKSAFHPRDDFETSRGRHFFLLEPGLIKDWFGGIDDFYFPETLISGVSLEAVFIDMTEAQVKDANWEKPPIIDSYRKV